MGVSGLPSRRLAGRGARQPHGLSALWSPPAHRRPRAHPPAGRRGELPRTVAAGEHSRPPALRRPHAVPGAGARGAGAHRPHRGHRHRDCPHRGHALRARRHGLRLHGREHGQRGRREAVAGGGAGGRGRSAAGGRVQFRRGTHAGRRPQPHADGEDGLRRGPPERGPGPFRGRARRPVHGGCHRQLRHPRRHLCRRARGPAQLLRTARHRRDDPRTAPRGLRQRRAQPGAGSPRCCRPPAGVERQGQQVPASAGRG